MDDIYQLLKVAKSQIPRDVYEDEDLKWRCGATAHAVSTLLKDTYKTYEITKKHRLEKLRGILHDSNKLVFLYITSYSGPLCHVMIWILTETTAYTLQSWVNELKPSIWSLPRKTFLNAIDTISMKRCIDDDYKKAFNQLTHIATNAKVYNKTKKPPVFEFMLILPSLI
jgi:hypothetical protein